MITEQGERVQPVLPAPSFNRAGDFVFVSSIYPIDATGTVAHANSFSPYVGESEMAAQTRSVLETLRQVLESAGTTLDQTLKVEVYLVDPGDFYEFKLIWKEFFPESPPARTTAGVGDEHIIPGCLLNLHAIALAGDPAYQRETIHVDGIPDPMDAEWVPHAIKAGPFVFPSIVPATDFTTGIPVGKLDVYPYYGSEAEMQAHYLLAQLGKVLEAAGSGLDQGVKCQFYELDLNTFHDVDGVWAQYMGAIPPTRSSMAMRSLMVPGAIFVPNIMFIAPDEHHQKEETRAGIRWHPVDIRKVNFTPGISVGDWLFTAGKTAAYAYKGVEDHGTRPEDIYVLAPPGLPNYFSDIEIQTEYTMELLREQIEANGFSLEEIVDARIFLINPRRDYRGFDRAWRKVFDSADRQPSMSLIPSSQANGGTGIMSSPGLIEIDLILKRRSQ